MASETNSYLACSTCRFVVRDKGDDVRPVCRPCPECGWSLMMVDVSFWGEGNCQVLIGWNDADGPMLHLHEARHVLVQVEELLDREVEEGLLPEPPPPTAAEEAETAKRRRLADMRLARQQREETI